MAPTAWQTAQVKVYDRDGTTLRATLAATGVRWTDELKGEGGASYTVPLVQAALVSDPDLLRDAIVKVGVPLTEGGAYTEVMAWLSNPGSGVLVSEEEDAGKQETPACRGIRGLIDDWLVLHDGGLQPYGGSERYFGWMSSNYSDAAWSVPVAVRWDADTNPSRAGYPEIWEQLDPASCWIGKLSPVSGTLADGAVNYFRGTYVNPIERKLRLVYTGDNYVDLYVNGELITSSEDADGAYGWKYEQPVHDLVYPVGPILIAAKVRNAALTTGTNPIGFIATLVTLDANGNPGTVVFRTNATNYKVTDAVTGQTGAKIWLQLRTEAIARGVDSASALVPSFSATADTASAAWTDVQDRGWEVGSKGSQVTSDLESVAFDLDVRPNMAVNAYVNQGSDLSASVAVTQGVNLLSYSYDGIPLVATRLLVRTSDKWLYLTDTNAELTYPPREHYLESGLSLSPTQGTQVGEANLDDLARESYTYTAVIIATAGVSPYLNFGKGDRINAYNYKMVRQALQVVSISGEVPADGVVRWSLELREP